MYDTHTHTHACTHTYTSATYVIIYYLYTTVIIKSDTHQVSVVIIGVVSSNIDNPKIK